MNQDEQAEALGMAIEAWDTLALIVAEQCPGLTPAQRDDLTGRAFEKVFGLERQEANS